MGVGFVTEISEISISKFKFGLQLVSVSLVCSLIIAGLRQWGGNYQLSGLVYFASSTDECHWISGLGRGRVGSRSGRGRVVDIAVAVVRLVRCGLCVLRP